LISGVIAAMTTRITIPRPPRTAKHGISLSTCATRPEPRRIARPAVEVGPDADMPAVVTPVTHGGANLAALLPAWPTVGGHRMHLTPGDTEKLLLAVAGMVARDRRDRGVLLNYPESVALLSTWVIERAREGASVADLMNSGREVLTRDEVMEGVAEMIDDVQIEATFPDGRKLVTLHHPIGV
jgi:urease subunit gamma